MIIMMANGDFETKFTSINFLNITLIQQLLDIIEIYGCERPNSISKNEIYFFTDALFRGLFKILIKQNSKGPTNMNRRYN